MSFKKSDFTTLVQLASKNVPGFKSAYRQFIQRAAIEQYSMSMVTNYSRCVAKVALHFGAIPTKITLDEINSYLHSISVHEGRSEGYFKQTVYGLRYWFKMCGNEYMALRMPAIKRRAKLPVVLAKDECKALFRAPRSLKHRFLLAFAYSAGLRMNELRLLKLASIDTHRLQIHVRDGKGRKDRYVVLSKLIAEKLPLYLNEAKPKVYLFEGITPGQPMGKFTIRNLLRDALSKTSIKKAVTTHTLRHSYATHLLEDGIDICSIQKLLGHTQIQTTIQYLHIAQVRTRLAHSPFDSLYERL